MTDQKKVFQGRTDEEGRTPVFRLPVRLPDAAFDLRERFGSGPYGETFHLTDHNGNDLFNMPYALITHAALPGYLIAGLGNGRIMLSANQGDTWEMLPFELGSLARNLVMVQRPM